MQSHDMTIYILLCAALHFYLFGIKNGRLVKSEIWNPQEKLLLYSNLYSKIFPTVKRQVEKLEILTPTHFFELKSEMRVE